MIETIVAVATAPGRGGIGVIRLSGPDAYPIALALSGKKQLVPRYAQYAHFVCPELKTIIDTGLMLYFNAPHSFTGEEVVELQAHGAPLVLDLLVQACLKLGARLAQPGEFSLRAFLNNKIDLAQAEAIADLINAQSKSAARLAMLSLQGDFSRKIGLLTDRLIQLRMYVEAAIDFPEEEVDFLCDGKIAQSLQKVIEDLQLLRNSCRQGSMLREGLSIVIAGKPNVGKSTLINYLAGREVAIVTPIAGTTRDIMREAILLDDLPIHLIDTAGLRESNDPVEQEGIKRAWSALKLADCVLLLHDVQQKEEEHALLSERIEQELPENIPIIRVFNKIDQLNQLAYCTDGEVYLSAKNGEGIDLLKKMIKTAVGYEEQEGRFLARRRHLQALDDALHALIIGDKQLHTHKAGELLAEDLRKAQRSLSEITGEFSADDLLGQIFSNFCIGK